MTTRGIWIHSLCLALICAALLAGCQAPSKTEPSAARFTLDTRLRYQTMLGWGGGISSWHNMYKREDVPFRPEVMKEGLDAVTEDLRLNFFQVGLHLKTIERVNDDDDPNHIRLEGFDFFNEDRHIEQVILPIRERLRARGERMILSLIAVLHPGQTAPVLIENPDEYIEFAMATLAHFRSKGLDVDYWVMNNEPDLNRAWTPSYMGTLAARLGERMASAGYRTKIAGPETVIPSDVSKWLAPMAQSPGSAHYLGAITYHTYDHDPSRGEEPPKQPRATAAQWGRIMALPVMQTEQGENGVANRTRWSGTDFAAGLDLARTLIGDLTFGNVSVWKMHVVTSLGELGPQSSAGGVFFFLKADGTAIIKPAHYYALRLFTRYVRPGSVRVELRNPSPVRGVRAVAFLAPEGRPVVVLLNENSSPQPVEIASLPPGNVNIESSRRAAPLPQVAKATVRSGEPLKFELAPESITTIW